MPASKNFELRDTNKHTVDAIEKMQIITLS
jgi:hypothetical protein